MADFELLAPGGHQKLVDEVVDRLDLKADIDGTYPTLTAGGITPNSVTDAMLAIPYWDWVTDENGDQRLAIVINE